MGMAKLQYQFDLPFELDIPKKEVIKALKREFIESFSLEENAQIEMFLTFLCENFFWEFFMVMQEELHMQFLESAKEAYFMEEPS